MTIVASPRQRRYSIAFGNFELTILVNKYLFKLQLVSALLTLLATLDAKFTLGAIAVLSWSADILHKYLRHHDKYQPFFTRQLRIIFISCSLLVVVVKTTAEVVTYRVGYPASDINQFTRSIYTFRLFQ